MNPQAPTLETDKEECAHFMGHCVTKDFARKLERERDEALAALSGRTVSCANCNDMARKLDEKDAQILALREALEAEQAWRETDGIKSDRLRIEAGLLREIALSYPAPEVVPLSKLQEAEAVAEQLAEALSCDLPPANCSCHIAPPCSDCVEHGYKREALAAHKARKQNQTLTALESLTTNNP